MDEPIRRDHHTLSGQLRFAGTRVPVDTLTGCLSAGYSINEYIEDYPSVTIEQVRDTPSSMLRSLTEGRRLDHPVVWCLMYERPDGQTRRVYQIHMTRLSAEAACAELQATNDWPGRWEVEDWLVIEAADA